MSHWYYVIPMFLTSLTLFCYALYIKRGNTRQKYNPNYKFNQLTFLDLNKASELVVLARVTFVALLLWCFWFLIGQLIRPLIEGKEFRLKAWIFLHMDELQLLSLGLHMGTFMGMLVIIYILLRRP